MAKRFSGVRKRPDSRYLQIEFTDRTTGKPRRISSKTTIWEKAQQLHDTLVNASWDRHYLGAAADWTVNYLLQWTWERYWCKKPATTLESKKHNAAFFLREFGESLASDITAEVYAAYQARRQAGFESKDEAGNIRKIPPVSLSTLNRERTQLFFMWKKAVANGHLRKNPFELIEATNESRFRRDRVADADLEAKLIEGGEIIWLGMMAKILRFAFATGWRQDQILDLKPEQINLEIQTVKIKSQKGSAGQIVREVPLDPEAVTILKEMDLTRPYVFHKGDGEKIKKCNFVHRYIDLTRMAGITDFNFHDIRHTWATRDWKKYHDLIRIMHVLCHTTPNTTMRYLNLTAFDIRPKAENTLAEKAMKEALKGHSFVTVENGETEK